MAQNGPTVAKAFVAIIPTTKGAQKAIADGFLPAADAAGVDAGALGGEALTDAMASTIKRSAGKIAAALAAVGIGKVVADITRGAVDGFSAMEQLTGGIETIFGEDTGRRVEEMASSAFRRVQMSANDYMSTVTSFSASLIQSMGGDTEAAADMADVALVDMADNANKMGTSMESLQNAYRGFARGTYTMLDNLALGYSGSQEEMLRLVHDAGVVDESITDINDVSFDQVIQGIHIIQERMGIAGASAAEAATTLEGSTNSMKAAWSDWLANLATGDMSAITRTTQNLGQAVLDWLANLLPRIATTLGSLVQLLPGVISDLAAELPRYAGELWTAFTDAMASTDVDPGGIVAPLRRMLESGIGQALLDLGSRISEAFGRVFGDVDIVATLGAIREAAGGAFDAISAAAATAMEVVAGFIGNISTDDIAAFLQVIRDIADAVLPRVQDALALVGRVIGEVIWPALQALGEFFVTTILPALQDMWVAAQPMLAAIAEYVGIIFDSAIALANAIIDLLVPAFSTIWEIAEPILAKIIAAIVDIWGRVSSVVAFIIHIVSEMIGGIARTIADFFSSAGRWVNEHRDQIMAVIGIIKSLLTSVSATASGVVQSVLGAFGWMRDTLAWIWSQVTGAVDAALWSAWNIVSGFVGGIVDAFWGLVGSIGNAFSTLASAITAPFASAFRAIRNLWNSTIGGFGFSLPDWVPGVGGATFSIPYLATGGDIIAGGSVIVGEAGPELLTLPRGARVAPLSDANATGAVTYQVMVGDVDLTSDEQVKRVTRDYLEFLVSVARPVAIAGA